MTLEVLLCLHSVVTPVVLVSLDSDFRAASIPMTFVIVFMMWAVHLIAPELENPFNGESNDLDLKGMQCTLNRRLVGLMRRTSNHVPTLVKDSSFSVAALFQGFSFGRGG